MGGIGLGAGSGPPTMLGGGACRDGWRPCLPPTLSALCWPPPAAASADDPPASTSAVNAMADLTPIVHLSRTFVGSPQPHRVPGTVGAGSTQLDGLSIALDERTFGLGASARARAPTISDHPA